MNLALSESERWALFFSDLGAVMPECILVLGMCLVILVPFVRRNSTWAPTIVTALTLLAALAATLIGIQPKGGGGGGQVYGAVFFDSLMIDPFSQFFKMVLLLFTMLVVLQWLIMNVDEIDPLDVPDFMCLLLGAATGMALMASANNLLMILVAMETASLPSFALAGFRKKTRIGSESSLKYVLFGSASSAIMIYGMSLIYGCTGTLELSGIAAIAGSNMSPMLGVGLAAMLAGFAFKLSAVPMHFWCPDVFQVAPVVVTTFLSVASKGAAIVMLVRVMAAFQHGAELPVYGLAVGVGILGAATATWGNIMAIQQTHIRRLLAYSSIAHAGYMIMAASTAAVSKAGVQHAGSAILFYLLVYVFMNLGAFTVGGLILARTGTEDIRDYAGLIRRSPVLAVLMTVFLLSLFGMPGLGGFMGKVYLMIAMAQIGAGGYALIAALLLNTLVSLYYYLRPVYYMMQAEDTEQRPAVVLAGFSRGVLILSAIVLFWTGLLPGMAKSAADNYATLKTRDYRESLAQIPAETMPDQPQPQDQ